MIPVMQTISAAYNPANPALSGNCLQAAVASLLEMKLEDVPHFLAEGDHWFQSYFNFWKSQGYMYRYELTNPRRLGHWGDDRFGEIKKEDGFDGFFMGTVYSPKFYPKDRMSTHAVIINKDFEIIHDPYYPKGTIYPESIRLRYNGLAGIEITQKWDDKK